MAFYCNGKRDICDLFICGTDCEFYDGTGGYMGEKRTPITNADHIRSMSDEELACYLALIEDLKSGEIVFKDTSGK